MLIVVRMQVRWAFGDSLPASELDVAVANKTLFMDWWEEHISVNQTTDGFCDGIILYTSGVNIAYRNDYHGYAVCLGSARLPAKCDVNRDPKPPFGFDDSQISIFAEVPDFVVPCESQS